MSGFYHYLTRKATEGSDEVDLVVFEKFVLSNRVVTETYQEDGVIAFEDCRNLLRQ